MVNKLAHVRESRRIDAGGEFEIIGIVSIESETEDTRLNVERKEGCLQLFRDCYQSRYQRMLVKF